MNDSKGSVVVRGQRSFDRCADPIVVPDGGGEGQDALPDADDDAGGGVAAVGFEVELAFEGVVDRLDDLAQGFEEAGAGTFGLALAGRAQQVQPGRGEGGFEVAAVVVLVRDQDLSWSVPGQGGVGEDVQQYQAFVGFGAGQRGPDRQAVQGAQQVQPQTPEVARMAGAVAVLGEAGQVRALGRLAGAATLNRGRVGDPHVVGEQAGVAAQNTDQPADRASQLAQPLVVARLLRQIRKQRTQVSAGIAQPPSLAGEPQQRL